MQNALNISRKKLVKKTSRNSLNYRCSIIKFFPQDEKQKKNNVKNVNDIGIKTYSYVRQITESRVVPTTTATTIIIVIQ